MNDTISTLTQRRSCRRFLSEVPARHLLEEVCLAGTFAPTGHGKQSPLILAVTRRDLRDRISRLNADVWRNLYDRPVDDPFYGAPALLIVLADREVPTHLHDGCAVIANLCNAAHSLGLASCWVHRAREVFQLDEGRAILRDLGIDPDRYVGVGNVAIGYADGPLRPALPRKADYVRWVE